MSILRRLVHATLLLALASPALAKEPEGKAKSPTSFASRPAPGTKARCAVAGEEFTVKEKTVCSEHGGRHYCFCCADCKPDFEKDPAKYSKK